MSNMMIKCKYLSISLLIVSYPFGSKFGAILMGAQKNRLLAAAQPPQTDFRENANPLCDEFRLGSACVQAVHSSIQTHASAAAANAACAYGNIQPACFTNFAGAHKWNCTVYIAFNSIISVMWNYHYIDGIVFSYNKMELQYSLCLCNVSMCFSLSPDSRILFVHMSGYNVMPFSQHTITYDGNRFKPFGMSAAKCMRKCVRPEFE